jgi:hypothetical protein
VVGNLNITVEEEQMISFIWGTNSYGNIKPLFEIRTTNGDEGENNALLHNSLRHQTVFQAIITFVTKCSEKRKIMEEQNEEWENCIRKAQQKS